MFNLSGSEIVIILLLALVVLGPDKLPEAMRKAGRTWAELRKMSSNFQDEVRKGFEEPSQELRQTASAVKKAATLTTSPVKGAVKSLLEPPATATVADDAVAAAAEPADAPAPDDMVAAATAPADSPAPDDTVVVTAADAPAPDDTVAVTPAEPPAEEPAPDDAVAVTPVEPLADGPAADESLVGDAAMAERAEVAVTEVAVAESAADDVVAVEAAAEQGATTAPPIDEVAAHNEEAVASEPIAVEDAGDVAVTDDAVAPAGPSS